MVRRWISVGFCYTNKTFRHNVNEILWKVVLNAYQSNVRVGLLFSKYVLAPLLNDS
jgi:hypothetical protein